MPALVEVALPLPLFQTFTYAVPAELDARATPGTRVVVPVRNKPAIGIVLGPGKDKKLKSAPKSIKSLPDDKPAFSTELLDLARWISEYYIVPIGIVLRSMLPVALTSGDAPDATEKTRRIATITRHVATLLERDRLFARAPKQRAAFELLESLGGESPVEHLVNQLSVSSAVLRELAKKELIAITEQRVARDPFATRNVGPSPAIIPSDAQRDAIAALRESRGGEVFLLHGVTGSGKTHVYLELLRDVVQTRGQGAIVLVPEIALTPQAVDRFRRVFGDAVAVLHSALSDGERHDAWLALRNGEKRIAVGARSAIFAPIENLGAIVVDEEHEGSYKQGETPRYHAREVAVVRGLAAKAVVVLGSATPSVETWLNATSGKYRMLTLPERVAGGSLPDIEVIDLRVGRQAPAGQATREARQSFVTYVSPAATQAALAARATGAPSVGDASAFRTIISHPLELALAERLDRQEQSILLLNRRGYAAFVQCSECGAVSTCPNCSITLTYHRTTESLVCHYCLHREAPDTTCRRCGGATMRQRGIGTQQVERLVAERFPAARIARMDVDTTSAKWSHTEILDRVGRGEVDILLGTQMIAKGLDFPDVTLVGVIDADVGINLPDFRASERCFQLLSQVAGRAGRGPKGGRVLVQTRSPSHHAVRYAVAHDYEGFVEAELVGRREPTYPPYNRLANVIVSGENEAATESLAQAAGTWIRALVRRSGVAGITVVGPAPCPVERIKRRWRWHVLLKADSPGELTRVGRFFVEKFDVPSRDGLRVTVDRDPVSLM